MSARKESFPPRVTEKQYVEIGSPAPSGGQGKYMQLC